MILLSNDASKQAIEFFIKRGDLAAETADHHVHDNEFSKGMKLYQQAYGFYKKALQNLPDDESLKQKIEDVRGKYQNAKEKNKLNV